MSYASIVWSGSSYVVAVAHGYSGNQLCVFRAIEDTTSQCTAGYAPTNDPPQVLFHSLTLHRRVAGAR